MDPRKMVTGEVAKVGGFINEFKAFISRGNVVDLAVGIIIGTAFTGIVNSLVADVIMPPIGVILGGVDFSNLFVTMSKGSYPSLEAAKAAGAATWRYGLFLNTIVNFLIIAFAVFVLVKNLQRFLRKEEAKAAAAPPPPPPRSEVLLEEIRDLLKSQAK